LAQGLGVAPVFLEKDWVLTEIIHACATGAHREQLVLKGGQALRHIHGSERLSIDVDYVARQRRIEFAELVATLAIRYPRLDLPAAPSGPTRYGLSIRPIRYRSPLGIRDSRVEFEVSFRQDLVLEPPRAAYRSPYRDPFDALVMDLSEMVAEKIRALYQRGNPRDLYDLWFIFTRLGEQVDRQQVARLLPEKFRPPLVAGGWNRARLYDRIAIEQPTWDATLRNLVSQPLPFDAALSLVERELRFLPNR
jgi:predicted nucleotidyltransferase component of viral defense system